MNLRSHPIANSKSTAWVTLNGLLPRISKRWVARTLGRRCDYQVERELTFQLGMVPGTSDRVFSFTLGDVDFGSNTTLPHNLSGLSWVEVSCMSMMSCIVFIPLFVYPCTHNNTTVESE